MSATPEQIAVDEKALEAAATTVVIDHTIEARHARAFARTAITAYLSATLRAQSEREKVLVEALQRISEMDGDQPARSDWDMLRIARAALAGAR